MTSTTIRSAVSPVEVIERTDLNPDAAMQSAVEDAAPPPPQGKRQAVNGSIIAGMGLVALIALWIFAVRVLRVPPYILPAPEAVLNALWSGLAVNPASPKGFYCRSGARSATQRWASPSAPDWVLCWVR